MRYFRLRDEMSIPGRWLLGTPTDARSGEHISGAFTTGESWRSTGPIRIPILMPGSALDFSLADAAPVIHVKVAQLLAELAPTDVQLIPVGVDAHPDQYCIMNVLRLIKCIDEVASEEVHHWTPEDGEPIRAGKYVGVYGLRIDPSKVGDARIFRTWGWEIALIVSEEIKDALERLGVTGVKFKEV